MLPVSSLPLSLHSHTFYGVIMIVIVRAVNSVMMVPRVCKMTKDLFEVNVFLACECVHSRRTKQLSKVLYELVRASVSSCFATVFRCSAIVDYPHADKLVHCNEFMLKHTRKVGRDGIRDELCNRE